MVMRSNDTKIQPINLRFPETVWSRLKDLAEREHRSANNLAVFIIQKYFDDMGSEEPKSPGMLFDRLDQMCGPKGLMDTTAPLTQDRAGRTCPVCGKGRLITRPGQRTTLCSNTNCTTHDGIA